MKTTLESAIKSVVQDGVNQIQHVLSGKKDSGSKNTESPSYICRHCGGDTMKPCPFQHPICPLTKEK